MKNIIGLLFILFSVLVYPCQQVKTNDNYTQQNLPATITFVNNGYGNVALTIYMETENGYISVASTMLQQGQSVSFDTGYDYVSNYAYSVDGGDLIACYSTYIAVY